MLEFSRCLQNFVPRLHLEELSQKKKKMKIKVPKCPKLFEFSFFLPSSLDVISPRKCRHLETLVSKSLILCPAKKSLILCYFTLFEAIFVILLIIFVFVRQFFNIYYCSRTGRDPPVHRCRNVGLQIHFMQSSAHIVE